MSNQAFEEMSEEELDNALIEAQKRLMEAKAARREATKKRKAILQEILDASPEFQELLARRKSLREEAAAHRTAERRFVRAFVARTRKTPVPEGKRAIHLCVYECEDRAKDVIFRRKFGKSDAPNPPLPENVSVVWDNRYGDDVSDITPDSQLVYIYHSSNTISEEIFSGK